MHRYITDLHIYIHTHTLDICILTHTSDIYMHIMYILETYIHIWAMYIQNMKNIPEIYIHKYITYIHIHTFVHVHTYHHIHTHIDTRTLDIYICIMHILQRHPCTLNHEYWHIHICIHIYTLHIPHITIYICTYAYNVKSFTNIHPYTYIHTLHTCIHIHMLHMYIT